MKPAARAVLTAVIVPSVLLTAGVPADAITGSASTTTRPVDTAAPGAASWSSAQVQQALDTNWRVRDASTRRDPAAIVRASRVAGVAPAGPMRVLSVRDVNGAPELVSTVVNDAAAASAEITRLQGDSAVLSVGMDTRRKVSTPVKSKQARTAVAAANDARAGEQWALSQLGVEQLWAQGITGAGTVVAVIDSGTDGNHPDLRGRVLQGVDLVVGSGNGWSDPLGHGTHVAGTIAATANNGIGVAGIAPQTSILPIRVADDQGFATSRAIINGIRYAVGKGVKVINMSLGGDESSGPETTMVKYALSKDVMVVAAAGNYRQVGNAPQYPAAIPGVLGVAASNSSRGIGNFSNSGLYVRISAPGVDVLSTVPGGDYALADGTSMASPHVAGVAALLRQATGGRLSAAHQGSILVGTADDISSPGYDTGAGYGLVNPVKAVATGRCVVNRTCSVPMGQVGGNRTQRYVQRAYADLSRTAPDTRHLLGWTAKINSGGSSLSMTGPLTKTGGYRSSSAELYLQTLLKSHSAAQVNGYAGQIARGATHQDVYAQILASYQYYQESGNTTQAWLTRMITQATGARPSAASLTYWTNATKKIGRLGVTRAIMRTDVALGRLVDVQTRRYWGTTFNARDRAAWVTRLKAGTRMDSLSAILTAASPYRARVGG